MPPYEIIRDDEVVVFYESNTRQELENHYLLLLRSRNKQHSYSVYKLNDELIRIGNKKNYIPYSEDKTISSRSSVHDSILSYLANALDLKGLSDGRLPELVDINFEGEDDE